MVEKKLNDRLTEQLGMTGFRLALQRQQVCDD